jgi:hypothetical protein
MEDEEHTEPDDATPEDEQAETLPPRESMSLVDLSGDAVPDLEPLKGGEEL